MTNSRLQPKDEMTKEEIEEREHFRKVIAAFKAYQCDSKQRITKSYMNLKRLPLAHQQLLVKHGFKEGLQSLESCVDLNHSVLADIISDAATMFDNSTYNGETSDAKSQKTVSGKYLGLGNCGLSAPPPLGGIQT